MGSTQALRIAWALAITAPQYLALVAAAGQSTVLSLPFYGYDTQKISASVVGVSSGATTLALACPSGTQGGDQCGLFPVQILTVGPNDYRITVSGGGFSGTQVCQTAQHVCTESNGGPGANFPGMSTTTYPASDVATLPVTVTAGADKLGAGVTSEPGAKTAPMTSSGSSSSGGGATSSTSTTGASAASSTSSHGAAMTVMPNGVVAAIAGAAALGRLML